MVHVCLQVCNVLFVLFALRYLAIATMARAASDGIDCVAAGGNREHWHTSESPRQSE